MGSPPSSGHGGWSRRTGACRGTGRPYCSVADGMLPPMEFASIISPGYKIALTVHILAVVLAFGPTFGYGFFFSVPPQFPRATPAILAGIQKVDRYLVNPGMIVLLLAGIYLLADGPWETGDAFIGVGFLAIIALFGLQHGFFQPKTRQARQLA